MSFDHQPPLFTKAATRLRAERARLRRETRFSIGMVVLSACLAIAALVFLTSRQNAFEFAQAEQALITENQARARIFEQYVRRTLTTADLATRQLATLNTTGEADAASLSQVGSFVDSSLFTLVAVHRAGEMSVLSGEPRHVGADARAELTRLASNASGDLLVGPPLKLPGRGAQVPVLRVTNPERTDFVVVFLSPASFTDFTRDITIGDRGLVSLIGLDGITRARRTGNQISAGELVSGRVMDEQLANPNANYLGPSVLDRVPRYFSHRRIPKYNLFVTSGIEADTIRDRLERRRSSNLVILVVALIVVLGAAAALVLSIRRRQSKMVELIQANARLNEAQLIGSIGDWDYFPAEDRLEWSENLSAMYGRDGELRTSCLNDILRYVSPSIAKDVRQRLEEVVATGTGQSWEIEVDLPGGAKSLRQIVAAPVVDESGRVVSVHGTDQDISYQAHSRALQQRVSDLARLDSMSAMAATLAHELNQPLAVAANYLGAVSRLTRRDYGPDTPVHGYLAACQEQIEHLGDIIVAARAMVSRSGSKFEAVSLMRLIDEVITMLRGIPAGSRAQVQAEISKDAELIRGNASQLKQVLFNLARNGLEAASSSPEPKVRFEVARTATGDHLFKVSDNGSGMDGLDDPFGALTTTKQGGLGLGLSISRTIVEAHGGQIRVSRTGSTGTVIEFTIPSSEETLP